MLDDGGLDSLVTCPLVQAVNGQLVDGAALFAPWPRGISGVAFPLEIHRRRRLIMIYELRVYRCIPGRLPALLKRFENATLKLWDKHGIKQAGFFTTLIGTSNQELTYFVAWDSLADREKKWTAFQSDPDWIAGRAKSEEDGQIIDNIVSQLLVPTAFSAVK